METRWNSPPWYLQLFLYALQCHGDGNDGNALISERDTRRPFEKLKTTASVSGFDVYHMCIPLESRCLDSEAC